MPLGGPSAGTAYISVLPDTTKLGPTLRRDLTTATRRAGGRGGVQVPVTPDTRHFGQRMKRGILPAVGMVTGPLAAAFAGVAIGGFLKGAIDEAREAAKVTRITAAVIKSTGGSANITAKQVDRLATALSNKTGVDDEAIVTSSNLLLTFSRVRNEAGKGNDIFNQSQTAIVDMTAAMNNGVVTGKGLKTSTLQIGKALNDPIKGMSALSRVGVTFTQGQKDQIAALVESGDKMGAQKIILAELRKEFGGAAAAAADPWQKFGVVMGNLKEQLGTALLPVLSKVAGFLADKLPQAFAFIGRTMKPVLVGFQALVGAFQEGDVTSDGFVGVMERVGVVLRKVWDGIKLVWQIIQNQLVPAVMDAYQAYFRALIPALKTLWNVIATQVWPILKVLAAVIGGALFLALKYVIPIILRLAGPVLGFLISTLAKGIGWIANIITWIARIGAALLRWITGSKTTAEAVKKLWDRAREAFGAIADAGRAMWERFLRPAFERIIGAFKAVGDAASKLWRSVLRPTFTFIVKAWLTVAENIIKGAALAFGWVPGIGPKLKEAARKFGEFRQGVNNQLNQINDEGVTIKLKSTFTPPKGFSMHSIVGKHGLRLPGYGGGDIVPAMLEPGEAVVPKHLAATGGFRGWAGAHGIPGFARGGFVPHLNLFSTTGMRHTQQGIDAEVTRRVGAGIARNKKLLLDAAFGGPLGGGGHAGMGWAAQMAVLRQQFPGMQMISGYRTRYYTATGGHSYHNMGRAVDIPPVMGYFNWIAAHYGRNTRELIFSPAGMRQIHNGSPHMYSGITRAQHYNHIHWAMDHGGWLPPGGTATNLTGKPERYLGPNEQVVDYDALAAAIAKNPPRVYLDRERVSHSLATGQLWDRRR